MRAILVLVLAAACGDDGAVHHLPDAPPPPDGAPDAAPQPVTIKISIGTVAQAGVKVFFQRSDFSLISTKLTDAAGEASEMVPAGGFVTALDPFVIPLPAGAPPPDVHMLRTFAAVKPGDHLILGQPDPFPRTTTITFNVPPDNDETVVGYRLHSACGEHDFTMGGGSAAPIILQFAGCGATSDIVIESRDGTNSAVHALYHPNAPLGVDGTIDLTADTFQPTTVATFNYTNVRDGIPELVIDAFLYTASGRVVHGSLNATVAAGNAMAVLPRASIPGAIAVTLTGFFTSGFGRHQVLEWGAPAPYTLDASLLLPEYQGVPQLDPATRSATWTSTGGGSQPDVVILDARFNRQEPRFLSWDWRMAAPYTGTTVTFPRLMGDAAEFDVLAGDGASLQRLTTAKVPGGYDAVRPVAPSIELVNDLVAGGSGRVVYEDVVEQQKGRVRPAKAARR